MSDDNPLERELGRPLQRPRTERELGRPLGRPSFPPGTPELDDEPLTTDTWAESRPAKYWEDEEPRPPREKLSIDQGPMVEALEWYFPLIFAACLAIVCYIGIYHGVSTLPGPNPLPPWI